MRQFVPRSLVSECACSACYESNLEKCLHIPQEAYDVFYLKRFSAAFQLMTSHMALKYSGLRFWYCRLSLVSLVLSFSLHKQSHLLVSVLPCVDTKKWPELANYRILILHFFGLATVSATV